MDPFGPPMDLRMDPYGPPMDLPMDPLWTPYGPPMVSFQQEMLRADREHNSARCRLDVA